MLPRLSARLRAEEKMPLPLTLFTCCRHETTFDRNKLKGATAMLNMFSGGGGGASSAEEEAEFEEDKDRLRDFQFKMLELQVRVYRELFSWLLPAFGMSPS